MIKKALYLISALLVFGCSKNGDLTIMNKTNHNIYYTLEGNSYILEPMGEDTYSYRLGKETPFNDPSKELKLMVYGETFSLEDAENNTTWVTIKPDKNLKLYLWPNHAGVKLINRSDKSINSFRYEQYSSQTMITSPELIPASLAPGDSTWFRLPYSSGSVNSATYFYYKFRIVDSNGALHVVGDSTLVLSKDEQYRLFFD